LLKVPRAVALICVETQSADEVVAATWPSGPDGARWERDVKTGDSEQLANLVVTPTGGGCCPA
jgi:hypothetical protein